MLARTRSVVLRKRIAYHPQCRQSIDWVSYAAYRMSLNFGQNTDAQLALLDLRSRTRLRPMARGASRGRVLNAIRHGGTAVLSKHYEGAAASSSRTYSRLLAPNWHVSPDRSS